MGVAVSNSVGGMVAGIQADGAFPGRVYNAVRKNLTAIEFGTPTSAVRDKLRANDFETGFHSLCIGSATHIQKIGRLATT